MMPPPMRAFAAGREPHGADSEGWSRAVSTMQSPLGATHGRDPAVPPVWEAAMSADDLLVMLTRRRRQGLDAEHRLARQRHTLDQALRKLRMGCDAGIVMAELRASGLRVEDQE